MFDRLIKIETLTRTVNAAGTPVKTWAHLKNKFAHVNSRSGGTGVDIEGERARTDITFTVRWDPAINYKCRIIFEDELYKINHIAPMGRHDKMRIETQHFENDEG